MSLIKQKPLEQGESWESRTAKKVDREITAVHWLLRAIIGAGVLFVLFVLCLILFGK